MIDLDALKNINIILDEINLGMGKVQYLGGLSVLITFEDSDTATKVMDAAKEIIGRFSSITWWEGQSLGYERLAWLKVQGIPLHLLTNDVIDAVGGAVGKVVHRAKRSVDDGDLSYEYVGVLVGEGRRVSEEVVVRWRDRRYRVWVSEERGDSVPEIFDTVSGLEKGNNEEGEDMAEENEVGMQEINMQNHDRQPEKIFGEGLSESLHEGEDDVDKGEEFNEHKGPTVSKERNQDEDMETEFVPGSEFDFDKLLEDNINGTRGNSVLIKRKKHQKVGEVGRVSISYSSSQEKKKVGKKQKANDLFGLNEILGLNVEDEIEEVVL